MQTADNKIIEHLNNVIGCELVAINQYFLHARMMKHMGFMKLADYEYKESIQQMKYADSLVERVLFLGGIPNLQDLGKLHIGEAVDSILECDLKLEEATIKSLKLTINLCESKPDPISLDILRRILENAEEHVSFIRTQINLIDTMGLSSYLQTQV
ncbi:MAG: bacterioferritin [Rickettsiales bacterium]|jgi:bacterioferritin